eukprot:m.164779 g.164779  ORF g.164779 m.164779 type:complete len:592 (+) comp24957_c0_seq2:29-1804(+)
MSQQLSEEVKAAKQSWLAWDKNPETRKQIESTSDPEQLEQWLGSRMNFGTAGLRAKMGPGTSQMNDLTIIQTSQGLCKYVEEMSDKTPISVVIGYDARHHSSTFARLAARAFLSRGHKVHLFSGICPTPFVPYSTVKYQCNAGVMVTASHNPKEYNGYKVYWNNGAQIISPHDKGIRDKILANLEPWPAAWEVDAVNNHELCKDPMADIMQAYFDSILEHSTALPKPQDQPAKITYTAMHGVGTRFCQEAFQRFGLNPFIPVKEQVEPDPEFSTVKYPNPEEGKGALALAMATADANDSTVILANDPDADRLAVAVKHNSEWVVLGGNQIGSLFAWWLWENHKARNSQFSKDKIYMLASTVSSKMLKTMAKKEGFQFEETLTGFKWLANLAADLETKGNKVLFSFEEAIGFCIGTTVLDKDGVCASVVMTELVNYLAAQNTSLIDQLQKLYATYGYHVTYNSYFICESKETINKIFNKVRANASYPKELAGQAVVGVRDLTTGFDNQQPDNKAKLPTQSGQMITFQLANELVITFRTSGTEPKIKFYSEIRTEANDSAQQEQALVELQKHVDQIVETILEPSKHDLIPKSD